MKTIITNNPFIQNLLIMTIALFLSGFGIQAQEICDNGIDDDNDGLVDCADPDCCSVGNCTDTFKCSSNLYQVTSGTLKVLDPSTGTYTSIGTTLSYNGTGYNVQDGYIYGIISGPALVRVNNTGQYTVVGPIDNFTGLTYSGDFDLDGNWLSFKKSGADWTMGSLDIDTSPLVMESHNVTDLSTTYPAPNCADISYNAVTEKYYGCSNGTIVEFDPINKTVRGLANYASLTGTGGFGASWSDIEGNTYFFKNSNGNIYRAQFDDNGEVRSFNFIAVSEPNGNNDGMSCPLSNPPVFPEICNNGIDDDNDGLVDCEDPDCTLDEDCGEICDNGIDDDGDELIDGDDPQCNVKSGTEGGLESNRRLSNLISKRNYLRNKTPKAKLKTVNRTKSGGTIKDFIPSNLIDGTTMLDASPADLIDITNAKDIFSTDVMLAQRRLASVLAIETENEVYEHTKYICDRLDGAIIHDLKTINVYNHNFLVSEIIQVSGNVEYAISFAAFKDENGFFNIESHWNLEDYPAANTLYNFQVWANNLETLKTISEKILDNINEQGQLSNIHISAAPDSYVSTGRYENGQLHLRIVNTNRATEFTFEGSITKTETGEVTPFNQSVMTYGNAIENIRLKVGSIYDIGFRISNNETNSADDLFFADGAWGVDIDENKATLESFEVSDNAVTNYESNEYLIHRNVAFEATTNESVAIYRSFTPKFRAKDFSRYNTLNMNIFGEGTMEITLVNPTITDWENQYKTSISLSTDKSDYTIALENLMNNENETTVDLSALTMMVLKFQPKESSSTLDIAIEDIVFSYDENTVNQADNPTNYGEALKESFCFPNPAKSTTQLTFETDNTIAYTFILTDNLGKTVKTFEAVTNEGINAIDIDLNSIEKGIYYYHVATNTTQYWKGKIVIVK